MSVICLFNSFDERNKFVETRKLISGKAILFVLYNFTFSQK